MQDPLDFWTGIHRSIDRSRHAGIDFEKLNDQNVQGNGIEDYSVCALVQKNSIDTL